MRQRGRKSGASLSIVGSSPPITSSQPAFTEPAPKAPNDLGAAEQEIWKNVFQDYKHKTHLALNVLYNGLQSHQLARQATESIKRDGMIVVGRDGQAKVHPLLHVVRDNRAAWFACVKALKLEI